MYHQELNNIKPEMQVWLLFPTLHSCIMLDSNIREQNKGLFLEISKVYFWNWNHATNPPCLLWQSQSPRKNAFLSCVFKSSGFDDFSVIFVPFYTIFWCRLPQDCASSILAPRTSSLKWPAHSCLAGSQNLKDLSPTNMYIAE